MRKNCSRSNCSRFIVSALTLGLMLAGCTSSATIPSNTSPSNPAASDPPPSALPDASTELAQSPTPRPVTLVESLEHPWGLTWLPDGTLLVTERPGRLRIIKDGVLDPTAVSGLPEVFARGQGGLMDVVAHPQFAENQWVYFTYADGTGSANRTQVARARFDGSSVSDWQVIFEVNRTKEGAQHFGSRLVWLPDGTLLVSIGDGGNPPVALENELIRNQAQKTRHRE